MMAPVSIARSSPERVAVYSRFRRVVSSCPSGRYVCSMDAVNRRILCKEFQKFKVNPLLFAFHIHCVDQKFCGKMGEFFQCFCRKFPFCKILPAICNNKISAIPFPAAQIQNQPAGANTLMKSIQAIPMDFASLKNITGHNNM